jgi:D-alanyl-D-alanine carboxypeptidase
VAVSIVVVSMTATLAGSDVAQAASAKSRDAALDAALDRFVASPGGSPGIAVVVQRGSTPTLHTAGVGDEASGVAVSSDDHLRLASVAKAFSGAAALSLVRDGTLALDDTIGARLPDLPPAWAKVTLAELLQHTSGIPDFSANKEFQDAVAESLLVAPPPVDLLSYVAKDPLEFRPGSRYHYSNSDNIVVGLMIEAATAKSYAEELATTVYEPLGLTATSLPVGVELPVPFVHGYAVDPPAPLEDVSQAFAAGWAWASGGIVSTPADANRFIRGYASGQTTSSPVMRAQFHFRPGSSEPPGPGTNSAGLGIFRYQTRCGDVYGHTGNTAGFTQFIAATRDGKRSATVSVNAQITPKSDAKRFVDLRRIFSLAVCAALT